MPSWPSGVSVAARLIAALLGPASGRLGLLVLEYTAASAVTTLRTQAQPAALGHAVLSLGVENHASFASQAAGQTVAVARSYRVVLAAELVAAVRALRMAGRSPGAGFEELPSETDDRPLDHDLKVAAGLLDRLGEVR